MLIINIFTIIKLFIDYIIILSLNYIIIDEYKRLGQRWGTLILEGGVPAEFSSNPNQTHLKQLINVLLGILETSRQVC